MMNVEDDPADTIRPRLDAAGGDAAAVTVLEAVKDPGRPERGFDLSRDLPRLKGALDDLPDCRLVVIDPVSAYLGGTDSHKNAEIRGLLAPLGLLARDRRVAVVLVSHLNKGGGGNPLGRVTGSGAFGAAVRSAWLFAGDPDGADTAADERVRSRRLMLPMKNNLAPNTGGLAYSIGAGADPGGMPRVWWEPDPVTNTAEDVLAAAAAHRVRDAGDGPGGVAEWLSELLLDAGGELPAGDVEDHAKAAGFSMKQAHAARKRIKAATSKSGMGGGWVWSLPASAGGDPKPPPGEGAPEDAEDAPSPTVGAFGAFGASSGDERGADDAF